MRIPRTLTVTRGSWQVKRALGGAQGTTPASGWVRRANPLQARRTMHVITPVPARPTTVRCSALAALAI